MEATSTFETSVNFYQTQRRNNPEDSYLLIHGSFKDPFQQNGLYSVHGWVLINKLLESVSSEADSRSVGQKLPRLL
jgi:hypothetical protein